MTLCLYVGIKNDFLKISYYKVDLWQPSIECANEILNCDDKLEAYLSWAKTLLSQDYEKHENYISNAVKRSLPYIMWRID